MDKVYAIICTWSYNGIGDYETSGLCAYYGLDYSESMVGIANNMKDAEELCEKERDKEYDFLCRVGVPSLDLMYFDDESDDGNAQFKLQISVEPSILGNKTGVNDSGTVSWKIVPFDLIGS